MMKRILLFLAVNTLVIATISIITSIFGLNRYLTAYGINYVSLAIFCLVWGMGGALISLALSKVIAKFAMGLQVIDPRSPGVHGELISVIENLCRNANIPMPEVAVYDSPEMNAFATGPSKKNSLVAVSTGLLHAMNNRELEGVLGHEISHIANGDMVTMTLIMGVVNAFSMFISRIISFAISKMVKEDMEVLVRIILTFVFDIIFSILGSILVAYFSRLREYKADFGGAKLAGKQNMVAALEVLQRKYEAVDQRGASLETLKISGKSRVLGLLSTHPPLEKRIEALRNSTIL